jgi:hypothetical protein
LNDSSNKQKKRTQKAKTNLIGAKEQNMNQDDKLYFAIKDAWSLPTMEQTMPKIRELATPKVMKRMDRQNAKWQAERAKTIPS